MNILLLNKVSLGTKERRDRRGYISILKRIALLKDIIKKGIIDFFGLYPNIFFWTYMYILHVQNRSACQWQWAWFKINSPYLQWVVFFFNLRKVLSIREEIWPGIENMTGVCFVVDYFYRQINIHVRRTQNRALITFCFAKVWMIRLLNYTAFPLIKNDISR